MDETISRFIEKNKWLILYGLFGIGTVIVNMVVYGVCARYFGMSTFLSNVFAWLLSLLFSYISNHKWVFENVSHDIRGIIKEFVSFISCRVMTGMVDVVLMVALVDMLHLYDMSAKIIVNFIVIVINLFACTHIIFKNEQQSDNVKELELTNNKYFN